LPAGLPVVNGFDIPEIQQTVVKTQMKPRGFNSQEILKSIALLIVCWVAVVVLFALQLKVVSGFTMSQALRLSGPLWIIWLLLAPVTIGLALRFPYGQRRNIRHAVIHIAGCLAILFTSQTITRKFMGHQQGFIRPGGPPPWVQMRMQSGNTTPIPNRENTGNHGTRPFGLPLNLSAARSTFDMLIYWTLISSGQAYTWIRRAQERERQAIAAEASAKQAQLMALQSQLNPHFLFNSLNAVTTLVHTDPNAADEMLTDLSGLLRASLDSKSTPTIPLSRELQLLDCYLEIEKKRFGDRLAVQLKVDNKSHETPVPTFILQPLVENAIRHGIERTSSKGSITLTILQHPDQLHISIRDTGPGLDNKPSQSGRTGIGLTNTRQRLDRLYGERATLTLFNPQEGGCMVTIELPVEPLNADKNTSA
jgi:hypothetical protein